MVDKELQTVWAAFFASKAAGTPDLELKKKLVEHYYPLVGRIAYRLHQKITEVQPDELTSMGVTGLYDAVGAYDSSRNTKFETYATPRINGSMKDAIRSADWIPRLVRAKASQLDRCRHTLDSEAGYRLQDSEMAEKMNIPLDEYISYKRSASSPAIHFISDLNDENDSDNQVSISQIEDEDACQPSERILRREFFSKLMGKNFTPQERTVVWLHYFENRSIKDISEAVGLSEPRVSQLHLAVLKRLKQKADRNPEYFSDISRFMGKFAA